MADEQTRSEIEALYFRAIRKVGNDNRLSKIIADKFDIRKETVYMRFKRFKFGTRKVAEEARGHLQYVLGVQGEAGQG